MSLTSKFAAYDEDPGAVPPSRQQQRWQAVTGSCAPSASAERQERGTPGPSCASTAPQTWAWLGYPRQGHKNASVASRGYEVILRD